MSELKRTATEAIWKYPLPMEDIVTINMPKGADVLCVQAQGDQPCLWAHVTCKNPPEPRVFFVVGTGHPFPVDAERYVGTFQLHEGQLVFHVFERKDS